MVPIASHECCTDGAKRVTGAPVALLCVGVCCGGCRDTTTGEPTGADLAEEAEPETIQRLVDGRVQARYALEMDYADVVAFYDDHLKGWTRRELDLAPFGETTTEWESADRVTTVAVSTGPEEGPTRVIIVGPEEG